MAQSQVRAGSFPGDLRGSQPNQVIQVSKSVEEETHPDCRFAFLRFYPPKSQPTHLAQLPWGWTSWKSFTVRVTPDPLPSPITVHYSQAGPQRRKASVKRSHDADFFPSTSLISREKNTAGTKCSRGANLLIFHFPKPSIPTLKQEAGCLQRRSWKNIPSVPSSLWSQNSMWK